MLNAGLISVMGTEALGWPWINVEALLPSRSSSGSTVSTGMQRNRIEKGKVVVIVVEAFFMYTVGIACDMLA